VHKAKQAAAGSAKTAHSIRILLSSSAAQATVSENLPFNLNYFAQQLLKQPACSQRVGICKSFKATINPTLHLCCSQKSLMMQLMSC
jgi:hypothetical protein